MFNKLISKAKGKLIDMIKVEPFRQNENAPMLTNAEQFSLSIGSMLAEHRQAYSNSLEMGEDDLDEVAEGLAQAWEIMDSETAKDVLNWLLAEGHRILYPYVFNGLKYDDEDELLEYIHSITDDKKIGAKIYHFSMQLKQSRVDLFESDVVSLDTDLDIDITAWDMGRCVAVARMCYEVSYLSEDEAWDFIKHAAEIAKPIYSSWKTFGHAYLVGRAMWSGPGMQLDNMIFDFKNHIEHENSPWLKHPWIKSL
ncbi:DUF1266 domain-containing protein [Alteromonas sp. 5E99-2]|uniref:DUF1266 domain-containing protein n=1 Tax=Alteromonas sp. 5E99-2 TaxID=2817683 RepID=UPI001A98AE54|nr:DUF1266 domain-containing protein [Alteromonas sp. 5E99-2]MBO1254834.1 DUF1266 domain-containing protein [Alteromonas sp. 5E99-2]